VASCLPWFERWAYGPSDAAPLDGPAQGEETDVHELGLAAAVVEIAVEQSAGRRVTEVHAKVGVLMGVEPGSMELGFELAARGTPVEGARLDVQPVPAVVRCRVCPVESELAGHPLRCPSCGDAEVELVSGDQLVVEAIEVEQLAT
jgi:hydrogenase nickel incorporation protein HypA/HybF